MKKLLAIICLFVLYVGVTAARADELVDMAQKMYPNEKINPINRSCQYEQIDDLVFSF